MYCGVVVDFDVFCVFEFYVLVVFEIVYEFLWCFLWYIVYVFGCGDFWGVFLEFYGVCIGVGGDVD